MGIKAEFKEDVNFKRAKAMHYYGGDNNKHITIEECLNFIHEWESMQNLFRKAGFLK